MNAPFEFNSMLVFAWLSFFLIMGLYLRARVAFIQKFLFPSCLVGGFAGLVAMQTGLLNIETDALENFGYHFFNVSFISVGLTRNDAEDEAGAKIAGVKGPA
ncbi:hypothetical protein [Desulfatibacillum aliphaticivorans]|uniref:hypothetical protein n=1 Tax=Desulfatibacillum aliphaticivorans TaxID=218208 RepID=UPI000414C7A0|nr:hypothetical protein [Desulfatibacillum aliphaticivorans]